MADTSDQNQQDALSQAPSPSEQAQRVFLAVRKTVLRQHDMAIKAAAAAIIKADPSVGIVDCAATKSLIDALLELPDPETGAVPNLMKDADDDNTEKDSVATATANDNEPLERAAASADATVTVEDENDFEDEKEHENETSHIRGMPIPVFDANEALALFRSMKQAQAADFRASLQHMPEIEHASAAYMAETARANVENMVAAYREGVGYREYLASVMAGWERRVDQCIVNTLPDGLDLARYQLSLSMFKRAKRLMAMRRTGMQRFRDQIELMDWHRQNP